MCVGGRLDVPAGRHQLARRLNVILLVLYVLMHYMFVTGARLRKYWLSSMFSLGELA